MTEHPSAWRLDGPGQWLRTRLRGLTGKTASAALTIPEGSYTDEAARFGKIIDEKIASIRARQDSGEISVRQAADLRVQALSNHLEALRALRAQHFGGDA